MPDKPATPRKRSGQPSVLGSLPATRPTRLARRAGTTEAAAPEAKPKATATASRTARKPKATASRAKPKPKATAARPKRTPPPPPEPPRRRSTPPTGGELVTTAVQAVGELAQISLGVGARALRRAAERIRP